MGVNRDVIWAERNEVVRRWEASGLSMAEFCRREAIGYLQFLSWKKRLSPPDETSAGFAELVLAPADRSAVEKAPLEIVLPTGIIVRVFPHADMALLRATLGAARGC